MRRLVFVCLLLMLPVQGVWSAVAGIGLQDGPCTLCPSLAQAGADGGAALGDTTDTDATAAGACCGDANCADCPACSGHGMPALIAAPVVLGAGENGGIVARRARGAPDHVPDHPLRPPRARHA